MEVIEVMKLILAGGMGAFLKDILQDNSIELPHRINSTLVLGTLGGVIVGMFMGYIVDGSFLTAFMGGYMGFSIAEALLTKVKK